MLSSVMDVWAPQALALRPWAGVTRTDPNAPRERGHHHLFRQEPPLSALYSSLPFQRPRTVAVRRAGIWPTANLQRLQAISGGCPGHGAAASAPITGACNVTDPLRAIAPAGESGLSEHAHHWLIGLQNGPSSEGVCKRCGERRDFMNSLVRRQSSWIYRSSPPPGQTAANGRAEQAS
jgi:hypothetical protein